MADTTNPTEGKLSVPYAFTLSLKVGGIVDSYLTKEGTLERLHRELTEFYGDGGYSLDDFHAATDEEVQAYQDYLSSEETEDDKPTLN